MLQSVKELAGIVVVRDSVDADGMCVLIHCLKLALAEEADTNVALIISNHTASHMAHVLRRAGINLLSLVETGRLVVVDVLHQLASCTEPDLVDSNQVAVVDIQKLYKKMLAGVKSMQKGPQSLHIMFDNLSVLSHLVAQPQPWKCFLHDCLTLHSTLQTTTHFLGLVHADVGEGEKWLLQLEHAANLIIDVEPLESGFSNEVSGKVCSLRKRIVAPDEALGEQRYYYKLTESGPLFLGQVGRV